MKNSFIIVTLFTRIVIPSCFLVRSHPQSLPQYTLSYQRQVGTLFVFPFIPLKFVTYVVSIKFHEIHKSMSKKRNKKCKLRMEIFETYSIVSHFIQLTPVYCIYFRKELLYKYMFQSLSYTLVFMGKYPLLLRSHHTQYLTLLFMF